MPEKINLIQLILVLVIMLPACQVSKKLQEDQYRNEILALHQLQRKYHFEKMAEEFAAQLSDGHVSVNRGEIKSLSKEEHINRFERYFSAVDFEKWDDISPPIIKFSDDYSLAYTIVDKEVVLTYKDDDGILQKERTKFSWVAIYKRYKGEWKIDCVASTNKASTIVN